MILMYHHIVPAQLFPFSRRGTGEWASARTAEQLELHINVLRRLGRNFISLDEYYQHIADYGHEQDSATVLTFDDGWIDNFEFVVPLLVRLGVTGTFFVTSECLAPERANPLRMGPEHLRHLRKLKMTVAAHSRTHPVLPRLTPSEQMSEIAGCKQEIEAVIDEPVRFFAYPNGAFDSQSATLVRQAGYTAACCSLGPARNDPASRFWLYRDVLSGSLLSPRDFYRLAPTVRRLFEYRVHRRTRRALAQG